MAHKSKRKGTSELPEYRINVFCNLYGDSIRNQILCYFLECYGSDEPLASVIELTKISKPAVYKQVALLVEQDIIVPTRKFRNMQLYTLNKNNSSVILLKKQFDEALNSEIKKYISDNNSSVESVVKELAKEEKLSKIQLKRLATTVLNAL